MKLFKSIPKKFERSTDIPFYYNDHFLTNGHFLVSRNLIKDSHRYCVAHPHAKRDDISKLIPLEENIKRIFKKTNRLFDHGAFYVREFKSLDLSVYIKEDYVQFFGFEELRGNEPTDQLIDPKSLVVIMPCLAPDEKGSV